MLTGMHSTSPFCSQPKSPHLGVEIVLEEFDGPQHVEDGAVPHPLRKGGELARFSVKNMRESSFVSDGTR